jgi:hypothetical protein
VGFAVLPWFGGGCLGMVVAGLLCLRLGSINLSPIPIDTMPNVQCGGLAKPYALRALLLRHDTPGAPVGRVAGLGWLRWAGMTRLAPRFGAGDAPGRWP